MSLHKDFEDLLAAFADESVRYLLIGGYAVSFHSQPRFTKDLRLWIGTDPDNAERAARALDTFGAPPNVVEALRRAADDEITYLGAPPVRVEIFKTIPGADFQQAWPRRLESPLGATTVAVISREDLIAAKRAVGRPQDLLDITALERAGDADD
jgi:hypothetical protein